jgi:adenosine deaminase
MQRLKLSFLLLLVNSILCANPSDYLNQIKKDPNALYAFLKEMPKGGELHYHLSGGAYPEAMLALAASRDYCLEKQTFRITKASAPCPGYSAREIVQNQSLYNQTLRAWSLQDFSAGKETGHDHFFATFFKFGKLIEDFSPELLAEVMLRASKQHELYLEIMITPDNAKSASFAKQVNLKEGFDAMRSKLLANKDFVENVKYTASEAKRILTQARHHLGCDERPELPACKLTIKFQYYVLREQPLENVFAQALNGFAAASNSEEIVGINLVQPEDGLISLRDYHQQMQLFDELHKRYPKVHISLHAGELEPFATAPENLDFHIADAIGTGHAERIGHGVDIGFENQADKLIKMMAKNKIAVEINLTSNQKILGISGTHHPLNYYLRQHVPVVLSTDDEGILRTDLTQEYVKAVLEQGLDYPTLKMISRNALSYSFLAGKSLWLDAEKALKVGACQDLESPSCLQFAKENEKAKLQRQLELDFIHFERDHAK